MEELKEIKDKKINKIILPIISVLVLILLVVGVSYAYLNFNLFGTKNNTIIVGGLTVILDDSTSTGINLANAYPISQANGMKTASYNFTITNKNVTANYVVKLINADNQVTNTPDSAIRYNLKKNGIDSTKLLSEATNRILDSGTLQKGDTNTYELKLWIDYNAGNEAQNTNFYGKIKVEVNQDTPTMTLADAVVTNLKNTGTTYKAEDGSTYIRGESNVVNNYVWYSGMMWRVYRINPDGSVKVVMDDNASAFSYGDNNTYDTSHMKTWLNTYFWERLNTSKTTVLKQNNEFCIDSVAPADKDTSAREECANKVNGKIGLLTLDEYNIVKNGSNSNYLNNGTYHWTMTPHASGASFVWSVNSDGNANASDVSSACGSRAVVLFANAITIAGGNGSQGDPYKIANDVVKATNGTKLNTRYSGELITYDDKLFRIMEVSNGLTKVVYDGATVITPTGVFGSNNLDWNTIKTRLEGSGISKSKLAIDQIWQRGYMEYGNNVLTTSLANGNAVTSTFGLPKVGEMWSGQNNTKTTNYAKYTNQTYWTMTPYTSDASVEWFVYSDGYAHASGVSSVSGSRAVFFFANAITIASGNGTPDSPYTLN